MKEPFFRGGGVGRRDLHRRQPKGFTLAEILVALALIAQRPELVRRIGWSAATPSALAKAQQRGVAIREFSLAEAGAAAVGESALGSQLDDLIEFFGAGAAT